MSNTCGFWRSVVRGLYGISAAGCIFVLSADAALAQRGREGGGGGRGNPGGGGRGRAAAPNVGGGARATGGGQVRTPAGNVGGGARVTAPGVSGGGRAQVATPQGVPGTSAGVRAPGFSGGADARGRGNLNAGANINPGPNFGANSGANSNVRGDVNRNNAARGDANLGAGITARGQAAGRAGAAAAGGIGAGAATSDLGERIRASAGVDGNARTVLRPNLDADARGQADVDGRADVDARGRFDRDARGVDADVRGRAGADLGDRIRGDADARARAGVDSDNRIGDVDGRLRGDAEARVRGDVDGRPGRNIDGQAAANFRANWYNNDARLSGFRNAFGSAINAQVNRNFNGRWNPADRWGQNGYWSRWGSNVRGGWGWGPGIYFGNNNFWYNRTPIGFGIGYGSWPGGWWGYSPWVGNRPWSYWYGNPGWNTFAGYYGWSSPYYYDYGPSGNIVYSGNSVLVNGQSVGTAEQYAQSAAELAVVTDEQMNAAHDWVPLGTFAVAISENDSNPARVAQIAHDNKQGLISGTIYNKESGNVYTLQGKVDQQTQRVAFTIGKDPNVVMETGLYNLTQNETPVLVHFGPEKTATYLFVRLPEPDSADQDARAADAQPAARPADDFQR